MAANDVILLGEMVDRSRVETDGLTASEQETYFFAKHFLKAFAPGHDDLLAGIVDGSNDGGIDGIYIFVNGNCVRDDVPLRGMGYGADLQLILLQVKNVSGFSEDAVDKFTIHLPELLDFDRDEEALSRRFNRRVLEVTRRFLTVIQTLEMPELRATVAFASFRAERGPHPNVSAKAQNVSRAIKHCFGTSEPTVVFLDAAEVSDRARYRPPSQKTLVLAENPISTDRSGGYIGVASLPEYCRFISDELGRLDGPMFDANVRDYESESGVNQSIQETLEEAESDVDFWWLNNGVTVVADKVQLNNKRLTLATPQVVNGLQTSHEIFKRGQRAELDPGRSVLVKVIEADREVTKDRIIKATNSQTNLGTATLRATDGLQRKIEEYFATIGLSYERRKNYYRNQQIPLTELVSIDQLGQAVVATLAQAPHIARGSVSLIFEDDIYPRVFHEQHPLAAYGQAISIVRSCEKFLRSDHRTRGETDNFVFHLAMITAVAMTKRLRPSAIELAAVDRIPDAALLGELLLLVQHAYSQVVTSKDFVLFDEVAKDELSTKRVLAQAAHYLRVGLSERGRRGKSG